MESRGPAIGGRVGVVPPIVYLLFFLSGFTALVFEILWSRQFVTVFGNSSYSISVVLCAYMAGLGFGSWLGGRLADQTRRWLLLYAGIEAAIGLWALLIPLVLDGLRTWVPEVSLLAPDQSLLISSSLRFLISLVTLFLPCTLMGATLPLLVRYCSEGRGEVGTTVGTLYGINTVGAAIGCFAAGYWMLEAFGIAATNRTAAIIDLLLAAAAAALAFKLGPAPETSGEHPRPSQAEESEASAVSPPRRALPWVAFATGLAGLSCEVLWTRYLVFFNNVHYVFTTILVLFLLGLGVGSLLYRLLLAGRTDPLKLLSRLLLLLAVAVPACFALSAYLYSSGHLSLDRYCFKAAALTMAVPTVLMGAVFPVICAAYGPELRRAGRRVGTLAALNTAGAVVGALLPAFVFVPLFGVHHSILLMSGLYLAMGLILTPMAAPDRRQWVPSGALGALAVLVIAVSASTDFLRGVFLQRTARLPVKPEITFWQEGRTATSVVISDRNTEQKWIFINGNAEVPTTLASLSCFKLLGTLGPLVHPDPQDAFIIAVGGGIAAGATLQHPDVESVEIVDIEEAVIEAARQLGEFNHDLLDDSRVEVVINDGRNQLLMSQRKWPVIICDSTHPKASDSWVLYTQEFYRLVHEHLDEDGVFVQWLPTHGLSVPEVQSIIATFQSVFPHASAWISAAASNRGGTEFYLLLVATQERLQIDVEDLRRQLDAPALRADLRPYDLAEPFGLLSSFLAGEAMLRSWTKGAPLNTDDLPWTYYDTGPSKIVPADLSALAPLLQSPAPYLESADAELLAQLDRTVGLRQLGWGIIQRGRLTEADVRNALQMAELLGDDADALEQLAADIAGVRGGAAVATKIYSKAIEIGPANSQAHKRLGDLYLRMNKVEEALEQFRSAVEISPDAAEANVALEACLRRRGSLADAESYYRSAIESRPDHPGFHYGLGTILARGQKLEAAAAQFGRAVELQPHWTLPRYSLAVALDQAGRRAEAIYQLQKVLEIEPEHEQSRRVLSALGVASGNRPPP